MSADEIVEEAFAPVAQTVEKEHDSAKSTAENAVKAAKEKALKALTG